MRIIYILTFITLLCSSCTSDNFYETSRTILTDKDEYKLGDNFKLALTISPLDIEKRIRIYKNFKNLEISFALVNPTKGILNENWTSHSGQFLENSEIIELNITKQKPFTKTFEGKILDNNGNVDLSIPELNMKVSFDKKDIIDGTYIRIHGFCDPINPEFGASLEEYFEIKDIKIDRG
jgi:hypothetical protein